MQTLFTRLLHHAATRPNAAALLHYRGSQPPLVTTFAELAASATQFANAFVSHAPDADIIPLFLGKSAECIAAMLGAVGAAKAFAVLNKKLRAPQINTILEALGKTTALTDCPGLMTLRDGLSPDSPIATTPWWTFGTQGCSPVHARVLAELRTTIPNLRTWEELPNSPANLPTKNPNDLIACCLFTSGSTGTPKGVLITESDLPRADAEVNCFQLTPDDILLNILPFSFDVGLNQLLTAITTGCTLVLLDSWLPADILRAVQQFKVTGISAVPAIWSDMRKAGMKFDTAGPHASLRYITVSGGDLGAEQLDALPLLAPGAGIFKTYGQSEAFRASCLKPSEFHAGKYSVGKPFEGVRLYILDEHGKPCPPGEEGEIVHTGLGIMAGYLGDRDASEKLRPNPFFGPNDNSRMAIFTGDLGYFDDAGFLHIKGRRDAMLKVAGNRIYPKEVANQLLSIPGVQEAEVVGAKDPDGETHLFAFIIAAVPDRNSEITRALASRVPSFMVPRQTISLPEFPRTASGKPDRPALIELAAQSLRNAPARSRVAPPLRTAAQNL